MSESCDQEARPTLERELPPARARSERAILTPLYGHRGAPDVRASLEGEAAYASIVRQI